jgi:hypothetical protein
MIQMVKGVAHTYTWLPYDQDLQDLQTWWLVIDGIRLIFLNSLTFGSSLGQNRWWKKLEMVIMLIQWGIVSYTQ